MQTKCVGDVLLITIGGIVTECRHEGDRMTLNLTSTSGTLVCPSVEIACKKV